MRENFLRIDTRSECYRKNPKVPSCMSNSTVQCAVSMTAVDRSYSISTTYGAREQFQNFIKLHIVQKRISLITGKIIGWPLRQQMQEYNELEKLKIDHPIPICYCFPDLQ